MLSPMLTQPKRYANVPARSKLHSLPELPELTRASELMEMDFPEPRWAVDGLLPEGLTVLAGAPKLGKSWLAYALAVAVATGGHAFGSIPVIQGDVIYLALEDTDRRLAARLERMGVERPGPDRLLTATWWPTIEQGGLDLLSAHLDQLSDARLVIIDTLEKLRSSAQGNRNQYGEEYRTTAQLKALADRYAVPILAVHHTRKMDADDPIDTVAGTTGLTGAVDTVCTLRKAAGAHDAAFYIRGRDVSEANLALGWHPDTCTWSLLGNAEDYGRSPERQAIIEAILKAGEPIGPRAVAVATGQKDDNVRQLMKSMVTAGELKRLERGEYVVPSPTDHDGHIITFGTRTSRRQGDGVITVMEGTSKNITTATTNMPADSDDFDRHRSSVTDVIALTSEPDDGSPLPGPCPECGAPLRTNAVRNCFTCHEALPGGEWDDEEDDEALFA